jgi:hypothetical protein
MDWDCRLDCGLTGTGGSQNRPRTLFSSAKRPTPQLEPSSPHPTTVVATAPARHSIGNLVTQTKKGIPYPRYCLHLRNLLILLQFLLNSWLNSKNGSVKWNQNGNWVQTASKDQIIKVSGLCFLFFYLLQRIFGLQCALYNRNSILSMEMTQSILVIK